MRTPKYINIKFTVPASYVPERIKQQIIDLVGEKTGSGLKVLNSTPSVNEYSLLRLTEQEFNNLRQHSIPITEAIWKF